MTLSRPLRISWLIVGISAFQQDRRLKMPAAAGKSLTCLLRPLESGPKRRCIILTKSPLSRAGIWLQGGISGILWAHARQDPFQKVRRCPQARGEEVQLLTQERRERFQSQVARSAFGQADARGRAAEGAERSHGCMGT